MESDSNGHEANATRASHGEVIEPFRHVVRKSGGFEWSMMFFSGVSQGSMKENTQNPATQTEKQVFYKRQKGKESYQ